MANWKSKAMAQPPAQAVPPCLTSFEAAGKSMLASGISSQHHAEARAALLSGDIESAVALASGQEGVWPFYVRAVHDWHGKRWMRSVSGCVKGMTIPPSNPADHHYQTLLRQIQLQFTANMPRFLAVKPRPKLSVCLIVKDEERSLERCLSSVKPVADEIVVVDTGSTDRTLEIAEKAGAKIGNFDWVDDFAAARNAALELATGDWVLSIDADEWLDENSHIPIRASMADPTCSYSPIIINAGGGRSYANVRLFPRKDVIWRGRLHEQATTRGDILPVQLSALVLHHDGRDSSVVDVAAKAARNREVLRTMAENGEASTEELLMFEALIAATAEPEEDATIGKLREAADAVAPTRSSMARLVLMILAQSLIQRQQFEEALEVADLAERHELGGLWSYYLRSRYAYMQGQNEEANRYAKLGLAAFDDEGPVDRLRADLQTILQATK